MTNRFYARMTEEQKIHVVRRLAAYDTPTEIARDLKEEQGISFTWQEIARYHPKKSGSETVPQRWKDLFWETRKAYIAARAEIGIARKIVRRRLRKGLVVGARDAGCGSRTSGSTAS